MYILDKSNKNCQNKMQHITSKIRHRVLEHNLTINGGYYSQAKLEAL